MFRRGLFTAVALTALIGGYLSYQSFDLNAKERVAWLPSFSLPDLQGQSHAIDQWKGQVLIINFWATWCPPCLEEIPLLNELQAHYGDQGLQMIGIAVDDAEPVQNFMQHSQINYPVLIAGLSGTNLAMSLGNPAGVIPFSVIVDREGRIAATRAGTLDLTKIKTLLLPLL